MNTVAPFEQTLDAFDGQHENTLRRLGIVGDVHGEFRHIEATLKAAREANTVPTWLVFLGDLDIDRQPLRVEWKRKEYGAAYRRQWRKVHLGIDAQTLKIRAIEVTDNGVGDAPMLPELLVQIPPDEAMASVSGDGAYDTKACHAAINERGAQAVIPPRKNDQPRKETMAGALARKEALRASHRLGRSIWRKWSGYHRRSLVETKMHCCKRLGEWVMTRTF